MTNAREALAHDREQARARIMSMVAGPALNALVAELMGWKRCTWVGYGPTGVGYEGHGLRCTECGSHPATPPWSREKLTGFCGCGLTLEDSRVPPYSTDTGAALTVLETFETYEISKRQAPAFRYRVSIFGGRGEIGYGRDDSLALAACIAMLLARLEAS